MQQYTLAATSPRFPEFAKWFCITLKEGSLRPLATACPIKTLIDKNERAFDLTLYVEQENIK